MELKPSGLTVQVIQQVLARPTPATVQDDEGWLRRAIVVGDATPGAILLEQARRQQIEIYQVTADGEVRVVVAPSGEIT